MKYLLVNHIPIRRSEKPGRFSFGKLWYIDMVAQIDALRRVGFDVVLAAPLSDESYRRASKGFGLVDVVPEDVGFEFLPLPYFNSFGSYRGVRGESKKRLAEIIRDVDIVQVAVDPAGIDAWRIATDLGVKRLLIFDGGDIVQQRRAAANRHRNVFKRPFLRIRAERLFRFCRQAIPQSDLVFAHNDSVHKHFGDVWHDRCHIFYRSFVTESMKPTPDQIEDRADRMRDLERPFRLVVASRMVEIKAVDHVLKAMRAAMDQGARLELEAYGDGNSLPQLRSLSSELGVDRAVRWHGAVEYSDEFLELLRACDLMVITNVVSELSRSVTLSMALGLPMLLYRNPGHDPLVEQHGAGVLVPSGNVDALGSAMVELAHDRGRLLELVDRGIKTVASRTLEACHAERAALARDAVVGADRAPCSA